jgi:hypothetical protein
VFVLFDIELVVLFIVLHCLAYLVVVLCVSDILKEQQLGEELFVYSAERLD